MFVDLSEGLCGDSHLYSPLPIFLPFNNTKTSSTIDVKTFLSAFSFLFSYNPLFHTIQQMEEVQINELQRQSRQVKNKCVVTMSCRDHVVVPRR